MVKKENLELDLSNSEDEKDPQKDLTDYGKKFMDKIGKKQDQTTDDRFTPAHRGRQTIGKFNKKINEPKSKNEEIKPVEKGETERVVEKVDLRSKEKVTEIEDTQIVKEAETEKEIRKTDLIQEAEKPIENKPEVQKVTLEFPEGFLWGTSTSAYQVEGGNKNDWSEWEQSPGRTAKIKKAGLDPKEFICGQAGDYYNRYAEDLDFAKKLYTNAIRFGIEWSRVEPKEGVWDVEAIKHYRKQVETAKKKGFKIVLTLWHWTNPTWVANQGGWASAKTVDNYLKYVDVIVKEVGAHVDYWITLNEPMVPIGFGYLTGNFPPGKKFKFIKAIKSINNLAEANNQAYDIIHDHFPNAQSSVTILANYNMPARKWCPAELLHAKVVDYFSFKMFLNKIKDSMDFIGLDYYKMNRIVWYPPFKHNKNKLVNEMGWEVYPEGIYHVLNNLNKLKLPIIITENGTADGDDQHRADFIKQTLKYVHKAIQEGADVRGYFHWSLLDNFEWARGFAPKFGLYRVDRETFWRSKRPSANIYREICKRNAVEVDE